MDSGSRLCEFVAHEGNRGEWTTPRGVWRLAAEGIACLEAPVTPADLIAFLPRDTSRVD